MSTILTESYLPPNGKYYLLVLERYGAKAANYMADGARLGGYIEAQRRLSDIVRGNIGKRIDNRNVFQIFLDNIMENPFGAPIEMLNVQLKNAFSTLLKSPFVSMALLVGILLLILYILRK